MIAVDRMKIFFIDEGFGIKIGILVINLGMPFGDLNRVRMRIIFQHLKFKIHSF